MKLNIGVPSKKYKPVVEIMGIILGIVLYWWDVLGKGRIKIDSDRIWVLKVQDNSNILFFITVYLPHKNPRITEFSITLDILHQTVDDLG